MDFPPYDFDRLNEADIREEIVAPLLRHLGYRSSTPNNVIREHLLSYPHLSLGRRKDSDPILRGKADYICEASNQVRWVIEAKSPGAKLDIEAQEQAWTYANHPEIRAVYFCLTNGRHFLIFQTAKGPEAPPVYRCTYRELPAAIDVIRNTLEPDAILRDHSTVELDYGAPVGPGLRSIVRVTNGSITFEKNTLEHPPLIGLTMAITRGSMERTSAGNLNIFLETVVPFQSLQRLNERLGLHTLSLRSEKDVLSEDPDRPTVFSATTQHVLPKGEMILDLMSWEEEPFPFNVLVRVYTKTAGVLKNHDFVGWFEAALHYEELESQVGMSGSFRVHLA